MKGGRTMPSRMRKVRAFSCLLLVLIFLISTFLQPNLIYAQQATLDWQTISEPNAEGQFTLALSGNVPTTVVAFEFVITFDENQVSFIDAEVLPAGMNLGVDESTPGLIKLVAEGGNLDEGRYDFTNASFKMKNPGDAVITLARSTFRTADDEQLPATMMRSHEVSYSPQPSTTASSSSTVPSTSAVVTTPSESNGSSTIQTITSVSTSASATSSSAEQPAGDSGLSVKLALLLGSIVLIALIILILKLPKGKSNKRR